MPDAEQIVSLEVVGGPRVVLKWFPNMNAQDALEAAWIKINSTEKFTYVLQYYGLNLGYLVLMINETYDSFVSSSFPFFYWHFFVNGEPASAGIDNTKLNPSDHVRFSFDHYVPEEHKGTTMEAKYQFQTSGIPSR
jgi:hypothetical protein